MFLSKLKLLTAFTILSGQTNAEEIWDYATWGADWPNIDPEVLPDNKCGHTNQSPIDLKTEGWPTIDAHHDKFQKIYTNQEKDIKVTWNGHTSIVAINKPA